MYLFSVRPSTCGHGERRKNASSQMIPGRRDIESGEKIRGADLMMI